MGNQCAHSPAESNPNSVTVLKKKKRKDQKHPDAENLPLQISLRDWPKVSSCLQTRSGKSQLRIGGGILLHRALERGAPLDVVKRMLKCFPASALKVDQYGKLPLHYECFQVQHSTRRDPSVEVVKALLKVYPQAATTPTEVGTGYDKKAGDLPLHIACGSYPPLAVVEALLEACPEAASIPNASGKLPLHVALSEDAQQHETEIVELIVQALLTVYPDAARKTMSIADPASTATAVQKQELPLHAACRLYPTVPLIHTLIKANPSALSTPNADGALALHVALSCGVRVTVAEALLDGFPYAAQVPFPSSTQGHSQNETKEVGLLPLHAACRFRQPVGTVRHLLRIHPGAATQPVTSSSPSTSPIKYNVCKGDVAVHLACRQASFPASFVLQTLLQQNAFAAKMQNSKGRLALHVALETAVQHVQRLSASFWGEKESHEEVQSTAAATNASLHDMIHALLDVNPNGVEVLDVDGRLPLHVAAELVQAHLSYSENLKQTVGLKEEGCMDVDGKGDVARIEHLMKRLMELYPEGATVVDGEGRIPLAMIEPVGEIVEKQFKNDEEVDIDTAVLSLEEAVKGALEDLLASYASQEQEKEPQVEEEEENAPGGDNTTRGLDLTQDANSTISPQETTDTAELISSDGGITSQTCDGKPTNATMDASINESLPSTGSKATGDMTPAIPRPATDSSDTCTTALSTAQNQDQRSDEMSSTVNSSADASSERQAPPTRGIVTRARTRVPSLLPSSWPSLAPSPPTPQETFMSSSSSVATARLYSSCDVAREPGEARSGLILNGQA